MLSKLTVETIKDLAEGGDRLDGRKLLEQRKVEIETGVAEKAEGSARVKLGNTDVIVGIKLSKGTPFSDRPDEGVLMTTAELSQIASEDFERGRPGPDSVEVSRVIDRVIRETEMIDLKKLKIDDESVWIVNVDIYVLNADGNLFDAGVIGSVAALKDTMIPKVKEDQVLYGEPDKELALNCHPVSYTFAKVGNVLMVDPTLKEEEVMSARLTVGITDDRICALQKGGEGHLTDEELLTVLKKSLEMAAN